METCNGQYVCTSETRDGWPVFKNERTGCYCYHLQDAAQWRLSTEPDSDGCFAYIEHERDGSLPMGIRVWTCYVRGEDRWAERRLTVLQYRVYGHDDT